MTLWKEPFENIVGKEENTGNLPYGTKERNQRFSNISFVVCKFLLFGKVCLWVLLLILYQLLLSFIILFMIDLYKDNHVRACVCAFVNFFFKKLLLRNYWLDFYQIS